MRLHKRRMLSGLRMNMAPMIDVVFLLIIFCMMMTEYTDIQVKAEQLDLPCAVSGEKTGRSTGIRRLVVRIDGDGVMRVDGRLCVADELKDELWTAAQLDEAVEVVVRSDRSVDWTYVQRIMKACADVGIFRVKVAVVDDGDAMFNADMESE